jgi:hypothetical protein
MSESRRQAMQHGLELPSDRVAQAKTEILLVLEGRGVTFGAWSAWSTVYDWFVGGHNSQGGLIAAAVLEDSMRLRRRLNLLIWCGRTVLVTEVLAITAAAVVWTYWPLLFGLGLFIAWATLISPRQTATNGDLAATTLVFWEMMVDNSSFRARALDVFRHKYGEESAEMVEAHAKLLGELRTPQGKQDSGP